MAPNTPQKPQVSADLVDPQDRPRGEALTQWLGREGKVAAGLTAHFKTVILDPTVSVIATAVCRTHWGRQRFQIGHFDDLCGAKVRQVKNESQQTQREHEGSRFQQPLWYELLESVINWFGADKFKGIMAYYRKEGRLVR